MKTIYLKTTMFEEKYNVIKYDSYTNLYLLISNVMFKQGYRSSCDLRLFLESSSCRL